VHEAVPALDPWVRASVVLLRADEARRREGVDAPKTARSQFMSHETDEGLLLDYRERDGFLVGKQAALADWRLRRDDRDFDALCLRLYNRNWARKFRAEHPERAREILRRWREAHRDEMNARTRASRAAKRVTRYIVCEVCLDVVPSKRKQRFCKRKCRNQFHGVPRARARSRGLRNMVLVPTLLALLGESGPLTLAEIRAAAPACNPASIATTLVKLRHSGRVLKSDASGSHGSARVRWSLAERTTLPDTVAQP
jgi:hypothetical protein